MEYFIAKMVDPGEEFPVDMKPVLKTDEFKDIFNKVSKPVAERLISTNFALIADDVQIKEIEILVRLLSQISYFILDEPILSQLFAKVKQNLAGVLEQRSDLASLALCPQQMRLYMALA